MTLDRSRRRTTLFARKIVVLSLLLLTALSAVHGAPAKRGPAKPAGAIWSEYGLAAVLAGIDPETNEELRSKLYLVVYGPSFDEVEKNVSDDVHQCATRIAGTLGKDLVRKTQDLIDARPDKDDLCPERFKREAEKLEQFIGEAAASVPSEVKVACGTLPSDIRDKFHTGLSLRSCLFDDSPSGCLQPRKAMAGTVSAVRFDLLYSWLSALKADKTSMAINNLVLFGIDDLPAKAGGRTEEARLLAKFMPESAASVPWPDAGTAETRQRAFELAVQRARQEGYRLAGVAARSMQLPQEILLQTADAVDDVAGNVAELISDPKAALHVISDEIARSRLRECATFAGSRNAAEFRKCSGYDLGDLEATQCLVDQECRPKLNLKAHPDAYAAALTIAARYEMKELASANLIPRALQPGGTLTGLQEEASQCMQEASGSRQAAIECLSRKLKSADAQRYAGCLEKENRRSWDGALSLMECVAGGQQTKASQIAHCLATKDPKEDTADCFLATVAPKPLLDAMECTRKSESPEAIAACALGKEHPRVKALADCLGQGESVSWVRCSKLLGDQMPDAVTNLVPCLEGQKDFSGVATCAITRGAPREVHKAAMCFAQNGADPLGSGSCMIADHLNPYQQVALQCAVSSGGAPPAFATCAGGRLLIMRVQGCLKDNIGSGACFGPNNDFQKAFKAIFGKTIKAGTPIGELVNEPIKILQTTVALTGDVAEELKRLGKNIDHAVGDLEELGKSIDRGVRDTGRGVERTARTLLREGIPRFVHDITSAPGKIVKQIFKFHF